MSHATSPAGPDADRLARAALTYLAEPGDPALGALLAICSPAEVLAAIKADMLPGTGSWMRRHPGQPGRARSRARPLARPASRSARRRPDHRRPP